MLDDIQNQLHTKYELDIRFDQPARNLIRDPHGIYMTIVLRPYNNRYAADALTPEQDAQLLKDLSQITGLPVDELLRYRQATLESINSRPGERKPRGFDIPMDKVDRNRVRGEAETNFGLDFTSPQRTYR